MPSRDEPADALAGDDPRGAGRCRLKLTGAVKQKWDSAAGVGRRTAHKIAHQEAAG